MNEDRVSLVIPGRNCARTIRSCLSAVVPLLEDPGSHLAEIIFVDDGSVDDTAAIVAEFPVKIVRGRGSGPGAARNLGWRSAAHPLVWFVDADCVAEADALAVLLGALADPAVGGVSGSYGNMTDASLLSRLIHEEIVERHLAMPPRVDFLATFNVLYRRAALEKVGGFDERYLKAQDAELAFRVMDAGYQLRFDIRSRVRHYHPTNLRSYLATQRQQGYWRAFLHAAHRGRAAGDSYSRLSDHVQPPLAMLTVAGLPLLLVPGLRWVAAVAPAALMVAQVPMTFLLLRRLRRPGYALFAAMSFVRAFWRGIGLSAGVIDVLRTARSARRGHGNLPNPPPP
jgi:glycosyltransferase involved in cell wall biosynthesis